MLDFTQKQWVENRLIDDGKITRNTCLKNYISRLGAIISMLKDDGYEFNTQYIELKTPFGTGKDFEYKVVKYPVGITKHIGAEKIEPAQNGKVAHLAIESCTFCKSTKVVAIADVTIKDDMQINNWYVECQQCLARGSKQDAQGDAIYMWNKTPQYMQANKDTNSLFN